MESAKQIVSSSKHKVLCIDSKFLNSLPVEAWKNFQLNATDVVECMNLNGITMTHFNAFSFSFPFLTIKPFGGESKKALDNY